MLVKRVVMIVSLLDYWVVMRFLVGSVEVLANRYVLASHPSFWHMLFLYERVEAKEYNLLDRDLRFRACDARSR